jgi:hypothetical protein
MSIYHKREFLSPAILGALPAFIFLTRPRRLSQKIDSSAAPARRGTGAGARTGQKISK